MSRTPNDRSELRDWVIAWQNAGAALDEIKARELAQLDTVPALRLLADAFDHALRVARPLKTSGLVEQQRILAKLA